jgi:hypothetical protein
MKQAALFLAVGVAVMLLALEAMAEDLCPGTVIPEGVPTVELGVNRFALVDGDGIFDTRPPPGGGRGPGLIFTVEDTAGCSCEQIIAELELGDGHTKFGCSISVLEAWIALVNAP